MLWYVATPYTKYVEGLAIAYVQACRNTAEILHAGFHAYSPIVHSHPLAIAHSLPNTLEFWHPINETMMAKADGLVVVTMEGWKESAGVVAEGKIFRAAGKPIAFLPESRALMRGPERAAQVREILEAAVAEAKVRKIVEPLVTNSEAAE